MQSIQKKIYAGERKRAKAKNSDPVLRGKRLRTMMAEPTVKPRLMKPQMRRAQPKSTFVIRWSIGAGNRPNDSSER